jgi:hypothetical protein
VGGHVFDIFTQLPDLIYAIIGGTIDFKHVGGMAGGNFIA